MWCMTTTAALLSADGHDSEMCRFPYLSSSRGLASKQLQVILKPEPGNPQELYLGSLEALGIDTRAHDVRFVEDNWESPVLGAWGLGWEVWLNGMEITQASWPLRR